MTPTGLTEAEVQARRAAGQGNTAPPPTGRTYGQILRENVFTFINICIFILGLALALLGRVTDALVSVGVIAINILVSVVQEVRAKRTLDRIALLTRPTATVLRDGQEKAVSPDDLVVGDVLKVGPGDQIVLDGRVVGDGRMAVDESQLTGESNLIPKQAGDPVYSGSFCVSGGALYEVEKVGESSLANQITAGARAFRRIFTPLQNQVNLVIRLLLLVVVYLEFLLLVDSVLRQVSPAESVANATIVAGLVPNGLFLSISVAYALAAVRIIRYGALVQQANAVESLSNVDMLCLDKTGTLTANRLQVSGVKPFSGSEADFQRVLGVMAASAATGNKTSEAIAARYPAEALTPVGEVPFSSARKWSAVALDGVGLRGVYALGAPEMLKPYLVQDGTPSIDDAARALTDQGLRVLLVCHAADPTTLENRDDDSRLPQGMTPLGLVSLSDELRPEAKTTLEAFIKTGVHPKIISGDNPETVAALARQAGLSEDARLVSGLELDRMTEEEFEVAAAGATIFGRITPQQKERLVDALRHRGHYVAMIGDGVNDVLSLKKANLGIAMQSGSQATRSVADIVLLQDSFAALAPAVTEGQRIVNGMQDILRLFLTRIFTMALLIVSSMVIGFFPLALRSGSAVTLLSVGVPTILLAIWARPGPTPKGSLVKRMFHFVVTPTLTTSALGLLLFYGIFTWKLRTAGVLDGLLGAEQQAATVLLAQATAQTALASFLIWTGILLVIFVEPPTLWWTGGDELSGDWRPTLIAVALMTAFVIINVIPALRALFALVPLTPLEEGLILLTVGVWTILVRFLWRRRLISRFLGVETQPVATK